MSIADRLHSHIIQDIGPISEGHASEPAKVFQRCYTGAGLRLLQARALVDGFVGLVEDNGQTYEIQVRPAEYAHHLKPASPVSEWRSLIRKR